MAIASVRPEAGRQPTAASTSRLGHESFTRKSAATRSNPERRGGLIGGGS